MQIVPCNGYAVIDPIKDEGETKEGLFIAEAVEKHKRAKKGKVLSVSSTNVGDNGADRPINIKEGDTVLFGEYSGESVEIEGKEYRIVELMFIRAVLKD